MTSEANQPNQPLRTFPAHYGVAVLAAFGAAALQFAWPKILSRPLAASWWPLDAILVVAATGYLLATSWAHFKAAAWNPDQAVRRIWRLASGLPGDLLLIALTIVLFVRGPETSVLRAGLALLLPVLLAVLAASATVAAFSLRDAFRRVCEDVVSTEVVSSRPQIDTLRSLLGIGLLVAVVLVESHVPHVKPWEETADEPKPGNAAAGEVPSTERFPDRDVHVPHIP